jgi:glutaredoxin-like protein
LRDHFKTFSYPVNLIYFHSLRQNPEYCSAAKSILDELNDISPHVNVHVHDFDRDTKVVEQYGIMTPPAIVIQSTADRGLRYYGIPSGYEFSTLIHSMSMVGKGKVDISPELRERSSAVKERVEIFVFVTPSCPHCPRAASMAHKFALLNEHIESTIIEANGFPELSKAFGVMAVPKTVINKNHSFEGTVHEDRFVEEIIRGISR